MCEHDKSSKCGCYRWRVGDDRRPELRQRSRRHADGVARRCGDVRQCGVDVGDDGCVRTDGVQGLGFVHRDECERGRGHFDWAVQLRRFRCPDALYGFVGLTLFSLASAPLVSVSSLDYKNLAKSGGSSVTMSGLGFGASNFSCTASLTMADNCLSTAWTSVTSVLCAPRSYSAGAQLASVIMRGATSTWIASFSFDGIQLKPCGPCPPLTRLVILCARARVELQPRL